MNPLVTNTPLPTQYNGHPIRERVPYTMAGELIVAAGATNIVFPPATFLQSVDKPFEVWRVKLVASQLDGNNVPIAAPAPNINKFWRVRMTDVSKDQLLTKNAQLVASLTDTDDDNWWWAPEPYTIVRAEGFEVSVDNLLANNALRAEITFVGYNLIIAPPSETR